MIARIKSSRTNAAIFGDCLLAWSRDGDEADVQTAAVRVAEFMNIVCNVLTKK